VVLSDDARRNREHWDQTSDEYQHLHGGQLSTAEPGWGVWQIPERELNVLGDVRGKDVLELGCGAAQWSICLARQGSRPVGLDNSKRQLEHARELMAAAGLDFPLVHATAEDVPLPDGSFDVVFCDHGAMSFCEPNRTVPEAARLLRVGGLLAFNMASPINWICWSDKTEQPEPSLQADYFGLQRFEDADHVEFQLAYGEWIRLFRRHGFVVEDLLELRPPEGATTTYEGWPHEWARRWPAENIWVVRKAAQPAG
jgi:SAM-dependent methyltransferase